MDQLIQLNVYNFDVASLGEIQYVLELSKKYDKKVTHLWQSKIDIYYK
jgi:hypothetical protein